MKTLLIILFFVRIILANNQVDSLVNLLECEDFKLKYKTEEIEEILRNLAKVDNNAAHGAIIRFGKQSNLYHRLAIEILQKNRVRGAGEIASAFYDELDLFDWKTISMPMRLFRDSMLVDVAFRTMLESKDEEIKHWASLYYANTATLNECLRAYRYIGSATGALWRNLMVAISRFHEETLDSVLSQELSVFNNEHLDYVLLRMGDFNRYDMLPELFSLKTKLKIKSTR
ncbi:MAG: hypothetical protein GF344_11640 [Chitinivibrionales bacterium]|nr:hypothetical protein [Chitinivibrionales bacterium]